MSLPPLVPDPTLAPPSLLGIRHPRPFAMRMVAPSDGLSRAVAHVSNVEFVRWIDRAAELHADSVGQTRAGMAAAGRMWFVARHEVDYRAEVFPGQELLVFTWVRDVGRSASWRETVVARASDGAAACVAATRWAYVDLATRRPARIPPEVAALLDPFQAPACTSPSS